MVFCILINYSILYLDQVRYFVFGSSMVFCIWIKYGIWYLDQADGWQCAQVGGRRRLSSLHSQEDKRPETGGGQDEQENVFVCSANRINQSFQMFLSFRLGHCGKRQGACSKEKGKEGRKF